MARVPDNLPRVVSPEAMSAAEMVDEALCRFLREDFGIEKVRDGRIKFVIAQVIELAINQTVTRLIRQSRRCMN